MLVLKEAQQKLSDLVLLGVLIPEEDPCMVRRGSLGAHGAVDPSSRRT